MSDLLAELDDQMRAERMQALWKRHGKWFIAALVGIVLATALYSGYQEWTTYKKTQDTKAMFAVLKHSDFPNNVTPETDLDLRPSMRAVVMMNAAGSYLAKEEGKATSLALYKKLSTDETAPNEFRDLATLSHVRLALSMEEINTTEALDALKPLIENEDSAYLSQALIEAAALHAASEDYTRALSLLKQVNALVGLPDTLYLKARALVHVYGLKQAKQPQTKEES